MRIYLILFNVTFLKGAKVVALPECFNSPYGVKYFNDYAEEIPTGETSVFLSNIAKELSIYLVGGSIPERDVKDNKLYNTCTVWGPDGSLLGKYRKVRCMNCVLWTERKIK